MSLLEAVQLPEKVAIMHIKAHQKVSSELEEGNDLSDREAKEAAEGEVATEGALIPDRQIPLEESSGVTLFGTSGVKQDTNHNCWDTLFGWSSTATGILNTLCHPIIVLFILVGISLILSFVILVWNWKLLQ